MTRILTAAALVLATAAGSASAMGNPGFEVKHAVGGADVAASLDARTLAKVRSILHGGDSEGEKRARIKALVARR